MPVCATLRGHSARVFSHPRRQTVCWPLSLLLRCTVVVVTASIVFSHQLFPSPALAASNPPPTSGPSTQTQPTIPQPHMAPTVPVAPPPKSPVGPGMAVPEPPHTKQSSKSQTEQRTTSTKGRETTPAAERTQHDAAARTSQATAAYASGDYRLAEQLWRSLAEDGDGQAMNNLGVMYDLGQGVEMDTGRALHWFAESARTGNPAGMCNYGRMLEQGRGLPPNPEEAARWFDLAARQGQAEAQYNLGMLYELGRGVPKDDRAAAAWYSRAAAQQQTQAIYRLGQCYRVGQGVAQNTSRAVLLLYWAAVNGETNAMRALEEMAQSEGHKPDAVLFGVRLDNTDRASLRTALRRFGVTAVREDDAHICDQYTPGKAVPGARRLFVCYGPEPDAALGFLQLDYAAPHKSMAADFVKMVEQRFGPESASETEDAHLWNLGSVIVATRHDPAHNLMSLMYMVPRVYHLTQRENTEPEKP